MGHGEQGPPLRRRNVDEHSLDVVHQHDAGPGHFVVREPGGSAVAASVNADDPMRAAPAPDRAGPAARVVAEGMQQDQGGGTAIGQHLGLDPAYRHPTDAST